MANPIFVLRDDAGKLYPCQVSAKRVFCDGGSEHPFTVTDSKLTIGETKDIDIKDKPIVLIDKGPNWTIKMVRAFSDVAAFTKEIGPKETDGRFSLTTPTYDLGFGFGLSGQTIGAPLSKASNFSYIAGIEVTFGGQIIPMTYEAKIAGLIPNVQSDEPRVVDVEKPVVVEEVIVPVVPAVVENVAAPIVVAIDEPKIKVELPTRPAIEPMIAPAVFESESLFDTSRATIKNDKQLADYVRFLLNVFKNSTDVIKIRLVGKADARGAKVLAEPKFVARSAVRGAPDIYFSGNDQLAQDRAVAVQQWFSYYFKNSMNLDADAKAEFGNLRYAVFVKGTSEDLPVVIPVDVEDDKIPQTIPWDESVIGNTLDRENYMVNSNAEMENPEQRGTWYKYNNGELTKVASAAEATHLLFSLQNKFTNTLDWFVEYLDLNRVVNPDYSVVDEIDAVYSEYGFETKPTASPALTMFKNPNTQEEAFSVDDKFNVTTTRFDVKGGSTVISARYIPINRDTGDSLTLSLSEKRYIKAAILEAVAVPGRQRLIIHMNNISPDAAAVIQKFIMLHIPSDTIAVRNVVPVETHEAAKPVSITIGTITGGKVNFSIISSALHEYMKAWYVTQADATIPVDRRSFPGDSDFWTATSAD